MQFSGIVGKALSGLEFWGILVHRLMWHSDSTACKVACFFATGRALSSLSFSPPARADVMSRMDLVCCDQSAVAVRLCAGLAATKFALLSGRGATGRTKESKYLFRSELFFHNGKITSRLSD